MDIDSEKLDIPETDHSADITLPSTEFQRIVRDLSTIGEAGKKRIIDLVSKKV